MTTALLTVLAICIGLVVFFATGKKTPSRPLHELPQPSAAVQALIRDRKIIDAIKLYRRETGASLHEAKQVVDHNRN